MKKQYFYSEKEAVSYLTNKYPSKFIDTGVEKGCYDIAIAFDVLEDGDLKEIERVRFN